ncbi:hypothetical protein V9J75_000409 [Vibrio fluvialis]
MLQHLNIIDTYKVKKYNTSFQASASLSLPFYQVVTFVVYQVLRIYTFLPYPTDKRLFFAHPFGIQR